MSTGWQLDGIVARLTGKDWNATIDLSRPDQGLAISPSGAATTNLAAHILGVVLGNNRGQLQTSTATSSFDAYVRGADLVVTYDEGPWRMTRAQVYWRKIEAAEFAPDFVSDVLAAFDLILSVNTSLLDGDPHSKVRTMVCPTGAARSLQGATGCFLLDFQSSTVSYLEMVHPVDLCHSTAVTSTPIVNSPPGVTIEHDLFRHKLEKGVILRARIRAALVAGAHAESACMAAYERFCAAEPPLTV